MHEMSSLITAVSGKVCIMKMNTNAGPKTTEAGSGGLISVRRSRPH